MAFEKEITAATAGATKGGLEYTEGLVKRLAKKFRDRDIAFIGDPKTIDLVKEQRKLESWTLLSKFIQTPELRRPAEMGFVLRKLEKEGEEERLQDLRRKIQNKYKSKGLHIAELVQGGILGRYINLLIDQSEEDSILKERIEEILNEIDRYVIFVKFDDKEKDVVEIIVNRLKVLVPKGMIIFSKGGCIPKASKIIKKVKKIAINYSFEKQVNDDSGSRYDFIIKKDEIVCEEK